MGDDKVAAKLHNTINAEIWANEFMILNKDKELDHDTMRAWFANAIMVGHDYSHNRFRDTKNYLPAEGNEQDSLEQKVYKDSFNEWFMKLLNSCIGRPREDHPLGSCNERDVLRNTLVKNALFESWIAVNPWRVNQEEKEPISLLSRVNPTDSVIDT